MNPAPGTGPFKFKSFVPNETIEFTRNDQYYEFDEKTGDGLPYLDSVLVKKIVEETVRWTALRAGDGYHLGASAQGYRGCRIEGARAGHVTVTAGMAPLACELFRKNPPTRSSRRETYMNFWYILIFPSF